MSNDKLTPFEKTVRILKIVARIAAAIARIAKAIIPNALVNSNPKRKR